MPADVAKELIFLTRFTGVAPKLCRMSDALLITMQSERVQLAARYDSITGVGMGATVWVDGEEFTFNRDRYHFIDVWQHPDIMKGALLPVPVSDGRRMPAEIEHFTRLFARRTGLSVAAGYDGRKWIIGVDASESTGMRVFLLPRGKGRWGILQDYYPLQFVKDGKSLGDEFAGQVDRALRALTEPSDHGPAAESKIGEAPAAAVNSVRERRSSVIRV
jgi:hypothetical protein